MLSERESGGSASLSASPSLNWGGSLGLSASLSLRFMRLGRALHFRGRRLT